ncbi:uncharacterized protein LOC130674679 [Microplitis mediator]|uniref:uncharacterized protein LOC130674679 n=1 Tax=Microplitis mediator TaxID=375433 RepID=UPI00255531D9|nr:uncharacterized protein LOC130674679 [Microplitis mediator]
MSGQDTRSLEKEMEGLEEVLLIDLSVDDDDISTATTMPEINLGDDEVSNPSRNEMLGNQEASGYSQEQEEMLGDPEASGYSQEQEEANQEEYASDTGTETDSLYEGLPGELPMRLDENTLWDPIRPYVKHLRWLDHFKPGLLKALGKVAVRMSHPRDIGCPLQELSGVKFKRATTSDIRDANATRDIGVQVQPLTVVSSSTQTEPAEMTLQTPMEVVHESIPVTPGTGITGVSSTSTPPSTVPVNKEVSPARTSGSSKDRPKSPSGSARQSLLDWNKRIRERSVAPSTVPTPPRAPERKPSSVQDRLQRAREPAHSTTSALGRENTALAEETKRKQFTWMGKPRLCWNCRKEGHPFSACPEARKTFCQMCGRANYTARTCPSCGEKWKAMGPYKKEYGGNVPREQLRKAPRHREDEQSPNRGRPY